MQYESQISKYEYMTDQVHDTLGIGPTYFEQLPQRILTVTRPILPTLESSNSFFVPTLSNRNTLSNRVVSPCVNDYQQTLLYPNAKRLKTDPFDSSNGSETNTMKTEPYETISEQVISNEIVDRNPQKFSNEIVEFVSCFNLTDVEHNSKQWLYNGRLLQTFKLDQEIHFELLLENDPVIDVSIHLVIEMKTHQVDGVRFLWNQVFESTKTIAASVDHKTQQDQGGSGAILAHCMGLGKTFTTIVLLHTLFRHSNLTRMKRVLILCPVNTAINWKNEFHHWLHDLEPKINIYLFTNDDVRIAGREQFLRQWYENGGVLIMGYNMYRQLTYTVEDSPYGVQERIQKNKKRIPSSADLENIRKYRLYLRSPGPDLIICDEGHMIKNLKSAIACTLNQIRTRRRIILTGTPMQNNLQEYYAMVHFCKPNFLGTESRFTDLYRKPIEKGQHRDSCREEVNYMRRRVYALRRRLQPLIHRRDLDVLRAFLPPKFEYTIKIRCRPLQRKLYESYIHGQINAISVHLNVAQLFADYQYLMKIWTHPWLLQPYFVEWYKKKRRDIDPTEIDTMIKNEFDDDAEKINKDIIPREMRSDVDSEEEMMNALKQQWWFQLFDPIDAQLNFELSGKFMVLKTILDECESIGDKLLIFVRSLATLDYIEQCLAYWSTQNPKSQWRKRLDYFRMDGNTSIKQRAADMKSFNDSNNSRSRLYLISTLAGGVGVNLYSANRVVILDTSWNPAHDLQAMFRSYRLGQTKPVFIYRLIVKGTMEEKIYKRQITKQAMFHRVVDAKQLARHFTHDELRKLYQFDFDTDDEPTDQMNTNRIHDELLRQLLQQHADTITSYCEHDSFLIHNDNENLTKEEENQAKDEEENPYTRYFRPRTHAPELSVNEIFSNTGISVVPENDQSSSSSVESSSNESSQHFQDDVASYIQSGIPFTPFITL
ncbi:unnamed protein product [Adineta ricciae]|uniref:Uncharacterized protein n=1 Tax=Adineta ricciae TaxID=249248 RepID=A0A814U386_ADIRI|nr:unnamed protein product [Adineta ricciae]